MTPDPPSELNRVEMWATAHPTRFRLFELLREGPSTATRLARRLGESSGVTSYHLRLLARAGAIEDAPELGTARERWWRRPPELMIMPTDDDAEGRAISARMFAIFFSRDSAARQRFVTELPELDPDWHRGAFVGSWIVGLTPAQASELGTRVLEIVDEYRRRSPEPEAGEGALVSFSVLPWLES